MQDQVVVNMLKGLVIDGVHQANSGHPGGPMSSMDMTYLLFTEFLNFDPADPDWPGRDRFILSAGHMSMLLYSMLYGVGWLEKDDLRQFRQLHSKTPGHPENFMTKGVECTTGPLGQGAAMSVGFAIAGEHLCAKLGEELFRHKTYALVSDGDLQEGVALGSASLAGHLQLRDLIWLYDSNAIQLSGPTGDAISDDTKKIFEGFGWDVQRIDGHDHEAIRTALNKAQGSSKPSLIIADTVIGKGAHSLENSEKTHGAPLPADERLATKAKLGIPKDQDFYFTEEALQRFRRNFKALADRAGAWRQRLQTELSNNSTFKKTYDDAFATIDVKKLPAMNWAKGKDVATRNAFGDLIAFWADSVPNLIGGSADLEPSNMTKAFADKVGVFTKENRKGRSLCFGVREFPMSAICNGMALHGGAIPFDATFLSFADYSRPALRLGAIQRVRVIHEFTHDSFYLGEDGPTHQPIEQVMSLRLIPDLYVMRPADARETEVLLRKAIALTLPSALCLTRQKLPLLDVSDETIAMAERGAYVVRDCKKPDWVIFATGSEVSLALAAADKMPNEKIKIVSMPCWELFMEQDSVYRESILTPDCGRHVSIEAGSIKGWQFFTGFRGLNIGIDHYGASAPAEDLAKTYGFTPEQVCARMKQHPFGI